MDCINFTGFIRNDQLHPEYQKMDIIVIPTLRESFGISVLEGIVVKYQLLHQTSVVLMKLEQLKQ